MVKDSTEDVRGSLLVPEEVSNIWDTSASFKLLKRIPASRLGREYRDQFSYQVKLDTCQPTMQTPINKNMQATCFISASVLRMRTVAMQDRAAGTDWYWTGGTGSDGLRTG